MWGRRGIVLAQKNSLRRRNEENTAPKLFENDRSQVLRSTEKETLNNPLSAVKRISFDFGSVYAVLIR